MPHQRIYFRWSWAVALLTLAAGLLTTAAEKPNSSRVPLLDDAEAWQKLPEVEEGESGPLPTWARALATSLPRTTAAMLELDYLHRASSPLDSKLRARIRYVIARANHCEYAKHTAAFDLREAGLGADEIKSLEKNASSLPENEQRVLEFARKMTLDANSVTDDEVATLVDAYGDKQVVAMVLLIAYSNFQDRMLLTLGLPVEPSGPAPLRVRFAKGNSTKEIEVPSRDVPPEAPASTVPVKPVDPNWSKVDFVTLQQNLDMQRERQPRIRVPDWEEIRSKVPGGASRTQPLRIRWSLVCLGYQPELATGWFACMRTFQEESQQDRVFEESLFWVITRTIDCFY